MASIAGNKRHHCEHTLDVKHIALMEIEWGVTNKDVSKKFSVPKKHYLRVKRTDKIVTAFKSSGGAERQCMKEGTYEQVNLACSKWLQIQRLENIPMHGKII